MNARTLMGLAALLLTATVLSSCASTPAPSPVPPRPVHVAAPELSRPAVAEPAQDEQPVLVGYVTKVTDGDTIKVQLSSGPITVRFDSVDAPETDQPWGGEATAALASRVAGREVTLDVMSQDRYERLVAVVYLGDENINGWMVQQGHAWAYREYLSDRQYCAWEGIARTTGLGLWSLPRNSRNAPWEWRRSMRDPSAGFTDFNDETVANCVASMRRPSQSSLSAAPGPTPPQAGYQPPGPCRIKGNISDNGRIYHVPGSPSYDRTIIDESKGERWFCSDEEARAAGWRPPKN